MWRATVATATASGRRNKGTWSYLGLGLFLGDIFAKYGTRLRERVVKLQLLQLSMVLVLWIWRLSLVKYPWRRSALLYLSC